MVPDAGGGPRPEAGRPGESAAAAYRRLQQTALQAVERCLALVPIRCLSDVDVAEKAINQMRDRLIDDLRAAGPSERQAVLRAALNQTNVALSLIVGVEYPATGSQRKPLEMARDVLLDEHFKERTAEP